MGEEQPNEGTGSAWAGSGDAVPPAPYAGVPWAVRVRIARRPADTGNGERTGRAQQGLRRSLWRLVDGARRTAAGLWEKEPVRSPATRVRDPAAVLRSIVEPVDGIDLSTIEVLAEEEGLDRETARRTLERLQQDGSVRSERGPDGEEVFAWTDLGAPR